MTCTGTRLVGNLPPRPIISRGVAAAANAAPGGAATAIFAVLGPDGGTMTSGRYMPTEVRDQGVADKLGIPTAYLRRLHLHRSGCPTRSERVAGRSPRKFLVRCLRPATGSGQGVARGALALAHR